MNIIGDVGGQFQAFKRLIEKMPKEQTLCVGDLIDRGPQSKEIVQYCMDHGIDSLRGNHEQMFLDFYDTIGTSKKSKYSDPAFGHAWLYNGGEATIRSYDRDERHMKEHIRKFFPEDHVDWLRTRGLAFEDQDQRLLVTHASVAASLKSWEDALQDDELFEYGTYVTWCRENPKDRRDEFIDLQVFGHNSHFGLKWYGPAGKHWAVCLDDSRKKVLTGLHWPSLKIFQEPF